MSDTPERIEISADQMLPRTTRAADVKKTLVRLDGIAMTEDGKLTQSKLFSFLKTSIHDYSDLAFTAEEAEVISKHLRYLRTGLNTVVPILCGGEEICPFTDYCPFVKIKKVPLGRVCPLEQQLIILWTEQYIREYNVDPANFSELSLVQELAELDIYDRRATFLLQKGEGQTMLQKQPTGIDAEGNVVYQTQIHQAWEAKERFKNRKLKIMEALVGTRKEKYKKEAALKQRENKDPSTNLAELREKLEKFQYAERVGGE
jgi:hypothetical protein